MQQTWLGMRGLAVLTALIGAILAPTAAQAAIPSIPDGVNGEITCTVQTGANAGQRHCSGIFTTFSVMPGSSVSCGLICKRPRLVLMLVRVPL